MNPLWPKLALVLSVTVSACGTAPPALPARGEWAGLPVQTSVDSALARYAIERGRPDSTRVPAWDAQLDAMQQTLAGRLPTATELASWSTEHSPDMAALLLARKLALSEQQQPLASMLREELQRADADTVGFDHARGTLFLFVPGWLYRTDPATGADLARTRALLSSRGADVALAATDENGAVERNAMLIAQQLRALHAESPARRVVLVSVSKGGAETALALSMLRDEPSAAAVRAWVNIGGLLAGTALADIGASWPACWLVQLAVLPDASFEGIRSLSTQRSVERASRLQLPSHVLVVSYMSRFHCRARCLRALAQATNCCASMGPTTA
jgi:hypothetical protein